MASKVIATFIIPAVVNWQKEWQYSALRFVVTDQADERLVQYVLSVCRS
jgi:hypothetical protein